MKSLLVINSSGRTTRSITRHLTHRFSAGWILRHSTGRIINRDLGTNPPPAVNESWIAAAFAEPGQFTPSMSEALAISDAMIEEIIQANAIALGVPMYNFGVPAQLKAYIDQIVRIGKTFAFDLNDAAGPYRPLLTTKPVIIIASAGDGSLHPGGSLAHLNFLEPHLTTVLNFIGLSDISFVRAGYDEYKDDRFKQSLAAAELAVDQLVDQLG
jgi:FMN-dependent NADH-azoreductase